MVVIFLRTMSRWKDGKLHRPWSVVESRRVAGKRVVQCPLLYLGEINDSQRAGWRKSIAVLEDGASEPRTLSLFPDDHVEELLPDVSIARLRLSKLSPRRPRQWGACGLALHLWEELHRDQFRLRVCRPYVSRSCGATSRLWLIGRFRFSRERIKGW